MSKKEMKKTKKKLPLWVIILIISLLMIITLILSFVVYYNKRKNIYDNNIVEITKDINSSFKDYKENVEYKNVWTYDDIINNLIKKDKLKNNTTINIEYAGNKISNKDNISFNVVGESKITIILKYTYKYKILKEINKDIEVKKDIILNVVDTIKPVITGVSNKEITVGDSINLLDGITAMDEADGPLEVKIEGTVDTNVAGTYNLKVYAEDLNGNRTEQEFNVTVKEKPVINNNTSSSNKSNKKSSSSNSSSTSSNDASTKAGRLNLARAEAYRVVSQIIKPGMSNYEKARAICDYITYNVEAQTNQSTEAYKTNFGNEAYSALIMKISACSGRCKAVMLLCEAAGLQCQHINAGAWSHQWNKVLIDGVWYTLDSQIGLLTDGPHPLE